MAEPKAKNAMNPAVKQSLIAISVLIIICLVCGALLALCNDLLYVSADEKFNRTIRKVYSGYDSSVTFKEETVNKTYSHNDNYGDVLEVRSASDGSFVITSKGTVGAFGGGSVTILVAISPNPEAKILGWALQESEGQTFISNITEKHQKTWFVGSSVSDEQPNVTPKAGQGKGSGATYTENAISNAINVACYYARNELHLGANPEGDAKKATLELLNANGYSYTETDLATFGSRSLVGTALDGANDTLSPYIFVAADGASQLYAYVYGKDEDIKIVVRKDYEIVVTSDNVTGDEDFVANILAKPIIQISVTATVKLYTFISGIQDGTNSQVYTVTGIKLGSYDPNNYTLTVTIETEGNFGKVTAIEFASGGDGWADGYEDEAPHSKANVMKTELLGATSASIDSLYTGAANKTSGATQSANIITAAVKAALAHYDAKFAPKA